MTAKMIARKLGETGLCVCPDFLSPRTLNSVADDLDLLHGAGRFRGAGVGRGAPGSEREQVRTDLTYWLDRQIKSPAQTQLWRKIDHLKNAFNRTLFLGLNEFEGHYAIYAKGGYYQRHKDCFRGDSGRVVSFVLYLNRDWQPEDGGSLRIYSPAQNGAETFTDINPVGGTLVCFMSAESEHQVLESHQPRFSLAGWFKR